MVASVRSFRRIDLVVGRPSLAEAVRVADYPAPERQHSHQQPAAELRQPVIDTGRHLVMVGSGDQPVALEMTQRSRQHALRDSGQSSSQLGVAQRSRRAKRVDHAEGPAVASVGQHLALEPVVRLAERFAHVLRPLNGLLEGGRLLRDHSCAFLRPPAWASTSDVMEDAMTDDTQNGRSGTLVLGAGELGMAVLRELARVRAEGRIGPVSVLLRPNDGPERDRDAEVAALGIGIVEIDLASVNADDLAAMFKPFSQVICCTGFVGGAGTQQRITDAALRAGVDHYVPWQFGVDYDVVGRGSGQEVWDEQLDVRDLLRAQDRVRWTIVSTGIFTNFVFLPGFGVVDLERMRVTALGDWDHRLTATTPEDIGRLTALVAADRHSFADQVVHVAGDTFTYRELADTVEEVLARPVARTLAARDTLMADAARRPEDAMAKYRLAFARPDGVAWPVADTLNARAGMAMEDLATWLRRWRDHDGTPEADGTSPLPIERTVRVAAPERLIAEAGQDSAIITEAVQRYYGWWNADGDQLLEETVSPDYIDRTPPVGRRPDRAGLADAHRLFRAAFPDGRVHVLQQVIAGDRVVSHLRVTGRYTGRRSGVDGRGQRFDYRATDIMRIVDGRFVENWHVEDHESFHRQIA